MKLLFDASVFEIPYTGVAKSTLLLYKKCQELRGDLDFNGFANRDAYSELPAYMPIHKFKKGFFKPDITEQFEQLVNEFNPDIIHYPWNGGIYKEKKHAKIAMTLHDVLPLEIPNFFNGDKERRKYIETVQRSIELSDVIFTDSLYSQNQIKSNFRVDCPMVVNYLAPTLPRSSSQNGELPYFVYVGGYAERKGMVNMLRAFIELCESRRTKSKLALVGAPLKVSKEFQFLLKRGRNLGVLEEKGYMSDEDLGMFVSGALGLIYLSKYEGFGLPPLDAMHLGCPVITTNYSSLPEICGDAVLYAEPDDIKDVAEKILQIEGSSDLRRELSEKGLEQSNLFSWQKTADCFLNHVC